MSNILTHLALRQSQKHSTKIAVHYTDEPATLKWKTLSWQRFADDIDNVACAFCSLGLGPGDMVAIFSENRVQSLEAEMAAFANRAATASIYATSSPEQIRYILRDSKARIIIVGNTKQYEAVCSVIDECPEVHCAVLIDGTLPADEPSKYRALTWADLVTIGVTAGENIRHTVTSRRDAATGDDIATLIYTSGTTGEPKGAILTHSCFDAAMEIHRQRLTSISDRDTSLCFLPLSHIFEKAWTYYCLFMGMEVYINTDPHDVARALRNVRPTCMCSVQRFWEKVYTAATEKIAAMGLFKRAMVHRAIAVGRRRNLDYVRHGLRVPRWLEARYRFYDRYVLSTMRKAIGVDRGNIYPTAGAPLSPDIVAFLHAIGINIVIGYGLSETTATVTCYPATDFALGSVGTVVPEVNVRIGDSGEIEVSGPTVMKGYYNKPSETAAAFTSDGWLRTGDAGKVARDGSLTLTERIKDLFKTSNGKYIAPQALESRLGKDPFIEQVAIIGDKRKYVTAIIIPAFEALKEYARRRRIAFRDIEELVQNTDIRAMIAQRIEKLEHGLANFEKIKRFTLLPKSFTIEAGELTNTLKLRRAIIARRYAVQIEAMYR